MKVLVIHGPNLNLLGSRNPEVYGVDTLEDVNARLTALAADVGIEVSFFQSNHEGEIIDRIHDSGSDAIVINPGGFTHTSVAVRDAIEAVPTPVVEVHLSNIAAREEFRQTSLVSGVATGVISGFGVRSYELGLLACLPLTRTLGNRNG